MAKTSGFFMAEMFEFFTHCHDSMTMRHTFMLADKPSLCGQRFIYAGGARGGKARLESDQMSRKALPCKACVERSDYFRAARRHKNNGIISGCRKKPEAFSRISSRLFFVRSARGFLFDSAIKRSCVKRHICTVSILQESSTNCKSKLPACKNTANAL